MSAPFYLAFAALWAIVIFNSLVIVGLVRALNQRPHPSPQRAPSDHAEYNDDNITGQPVPAFMSEDVFGNPFGTADLLGQSSALLFVSADCSTCSVTLGEIEALRARMDDFVVVVCKSDSEKCRELAHRYELSVPVILDGEGVVSELFRIQGAPTAVIVEADGTVGTYGHPMSADALQEQLTDGRMQNGHAPPELAPEVRVPAGAMEDQQSNGAGGEDEGRSHRT